MILLWIAVGGGVGSLLRYLLGGPITALAGGRFPLGTLVINVIGSFVIGCLTRMFLNIEADQPIRAALIVGVCGGFTTFSTFSLETIGLIEGGMVFRAAAYVTLSVTISLLATALGFVVGKFFALG